MELTPTEMLIMEVLASRHRLGENLWTFNSNVTKQIESLASKGLVTSMNGNISNTVRAYMTDAGRKRFLSSTYTTPTLVGTKEWAVQERSVLDGPWKRIDTGNGWSDRRGKYTEEEARTEASVRYNGIDPKLWRRVVTRTVTEWEPEA